MIKQPSKWNKLNRPINYHSEGNLYEQRTNPQGHLTIQAATPRSPEHPSSIPSDSSSNQSVEGLQDSQGSVKKDSLFPLSLCMFAQQRSGRKRIPNLVRALGHALEQTLWKPPV